MPFLNRIRLPFYVSRPQYPEDRNSYKFADGSQKLLSVTIGKVYEGETDLLPEWVHERLKIAISHDTINIESDRYLGGIMSEGDYDIEWNEFKDYPYAKAKFKVAVTPFAALNSNCKSCAEASQLNLIDDSFAEQIDQSTTYELDVFGNDTISCSPFSVSITYINSIYVASATINPTTGVLSLTTKPLFFQRNTVKLITYRVTCSNDSYDEADVYANMEGTPVSCLEPVNPRTQILTDDTATIQWDDPSPAPAEGFEWRLAEAAAPTVYIDEGTTLVSQQALPTTGNFLEPATNYIFSVRSKCGTDDYSEWVTLNFRTDAIANTCGRYRLTYFDEFTNQDYKDIQYMNCSGNVATIRLHSFKPRTVCALQTSAGNPVSIIGADDVLYLRPC